MALLYSPQTFIDFLGGVATVVGAQAADTMVDGDTVAEHEDSDAETLQLHADDTGAKADDVEPIDDVKAIDDVDKISEMEDLELDAGVEIDCADSREMAGAEHAEMASDEVAEIAGAKDEDLESDAGVEIAGAESGEMAGAEHAKMVGADAESAEMSCAESEDADIVAISDEDEGNYLSRTLAVLGLPAEDPGAADVASTTLLQCRGPAPSHKPQRGRAQGASGAFVGVAGPPLALKQCGLKQRSSPPKRTRRSMAWRWPGRSP